MSSLTQNPPSKPIDILLVEDDETDVRLIERLLERDHLPIQLHVAKDGMEAMEFLSRNGSFQSVPQPDLVLLDLNMPRKGGIEVLNEMKSDESLEGIPVVIVSTVSYDASAYPGSALADSFITKPVTPENLNWLIGLGSISDET